MCQQERGILDQILKNALERDSRTKELNSLLYAINLSLLYLNRDCPCGHERTTHSSQLLRNTNPKFYSDAFERAKKYIEDAKAFNLP